MFFKKRMLVTDYCVASMGAVFEKQHEATWEAIRRHCNDPALTGADAELYYAHFRAVCMNLLLIGIAKNCKMDVSIEAHIFVGQWLKEKGHSKIQDLIHEYSQAFASSPSDGVKEMVAHFAGSLATSAMRQETLDQLHAEFYGVLNFYFADYKSIKLLQTK